MERTQNQLIFYAFIVALVATVGSLFFSNVMGFVPCILCWYQRIIMYPLVIIFLVGFLKEDTKSFDYAITFIIGGVLMSIYHNLIQLKIVPETASPCLEGVSCAGKWIEWLGFITIPMLSFFAFSILLVISFMYYKKVKVTHE